MHFSFRTELRSFTGSLLYIRNEHSLYYKPFCLNVGTAIICGPYTGLDIICETCEVVHISGLNPKSTWICKTMTVPKYKSGYLWAHFDKPPDKGGGVRYNDSWNTYYDEENQYICIGDYLTNDGDDCIEFANNVIAILRDGNLIAIWAKFKEVETIR